MDNNAMILLVVLGLTAIFFFFLAFMSSKTWRVPHVLLGVLVFFAAIAFWFTSAMLLKTRDAWGEKIDELQAQLQEQIEENERLEGKHSDVMDAVTGGETPVSVKHLTTELKNTLLYRGRVWRGVQPTSGTPAEVQINVSNWGDAACCGLAGSVAEVVPDDGEQPAQPAVGIEQNMVLYVFRETPVLNLDDIVKQSLYPADDADDVPATLVTRDTEGVCKVPTEYLGEYKVTTVQGAQITLHPVLPLDQRQSAAVADTSGTWVLYEVLPQDANDVFAGLTAEQIQALVPQEKTALSNTAYQALIEEYLRDGTDADENDPPERIWTRVVFKTPHSVAVDPPQEGEPAAPTAPPEKFFDDTGLAVAPALQAGVPTEFGTEEEVGVENEDRIVVLPTEQANQLIAEGKCEPAGTQYVRPLRDYQFLFQSMYRRFIETDDVIRVVVADTAIVDSSLVVVDGRLKIQEARVDELKEDLVQFQSEHQKLTGFYAQLQQQQQALQKSLSALYRTNNQLEAELNRLHQERPAEAAPAAEPPSEAATEDRVAAR